VHESSEGEKKGESTIGDRKKGYMSNYLDSTAKRERKESRVSDYLSKNKKRKKKEQEPLLASERIPEVDENDGTPPPQFITSPSVAERRISLLPYGLD
jgi:hypothetical protein